MSTELSDVLADIAKDDLKPLYLLWGEEFLVRQGADQLVKALVPGASAGLNLMVLDGAGPGEVSRELATLPLFPGRKVVLVRDPEFLAPKKARGDGLSRAREAWKAGRKKEGAKRLLALAARAGWTAAQLDPGASGAPSVDAWREELNVDLAGADLAFLKEVADFCREEGVKAPEGDVGPLVQLLQSGLPKGQVLVLAASEVDAKSPLLKLAKDAGEVVEKKVAGRLKDLDLSAFAAQVLAPFKKKLGRAAEAVLKDRCGGNMRLVQSELEKLAVYVDGPEIRPADVQLLVGRARTEEFLELTDALQKRDYPAALRYLEDALAQETHPLQLLGALASNVRTLLENHERMTRLAPQGVRSFDDFKARAFPKIEAELQAAGRKVPHPYGIFLGMQAAGRYSRSELSRGLCALADADLAIKTSADGRLVIERLLLALCGRPSPAAASR